jgi:hypothetical protein
MQNDSPIKGKIQRQEKIKQTERVEHPGLNGGEKWDATLYIRVPERKMGLASCLDPDVTERIKKAGEVPFYQKQLTSQDVTKIKERKCE